MPEHDDSTPSMLLHLDQDRYHCFGCGATGDVVQWVRDIYGVDTPTVLAMLDADRGRFPDRPTGAVSTLRSEVRFAAALIWGLGEEWPCSTASVATYVTLVLAPPLRSTRKRSSCAEPSLPRLTDRIVAKPMQRGQQRDVGSDRRASGRSETRASFPAASMASTRSSVIAIESIDGSQPGHAAEPSQIPPRAGRGDSCGTSTTTPPTPFVGNAA